jgi:hypothetical protein
VQLRVPHSNPTTPSETSMPSLRREEEGAVEDKRALPLRTILLGTFPLLSLADLL